MAGGQINITIGGNAQQLTQAAGQASASLNNLNNAANAAAAGVQRLPPAIAPAGRGLGNLGRDALGAASALNRIPPAAGPAGQAINNITPATNIAAAALARLNPGATQATFALTNLGRVAQDAPFGLIGIANNLEPLIASFIAVRQQAGSAGGAFRALGASLLGPGGLILGIGLISTVATLAGQGLFSAAKEADKFGEAMSKANEEAGKEIANLRIAATVASDVTRSTDERKKAAKQLQDQLKENNVTLTQEAILNGQVAEAIDKATAAIKERAKARAIENRIAELSAENLDRELQRPALFQKSIDLQKKLNAERAKESKIAGAPSTISPELVGFATAARDELIALDQASLDASAEINKLLALVKDEDLNFKTNPGKTEKEVDLLKQRIAALKELQSLTGLDQAQQVQLAQLEIQLARRDSIKAGFTAEELQQQIDGIIEKAFPVKTFEFKLNKVAIVPKTIEFAPNIDVTGVVLPDGAISENAFDGVVDAIRRSAENAKARVTEIAIDLKSVLSSVLNDAFVGLGESIAGAFTGGSFQNVINGFISVIGDAISALGKAAIKAGTAALLLKETLNSFIIKNPALVIAAGVAAVAIGQALKNAFEGTKTPGFADGVTNFRGGAALVGERGPEIVTLPAGANVIPNNPFGLELPVPSLFARGDDLYLSYNRTAGRRRRV